MAIFLVTYDLNRETSRPNITKIIRDNFAYAMLSESSYAVESELTPTAIYSLFTPILDDNDSLLVLTLNFPFYGQHSKAVVDWLESRLTY